MILRCKVVGLSQISVLSKVAFRCRRKYLKNILSLFFFLLLLLFFRFLFFMFYRNLTHVLDSRLDPKQMKTSIQGVLPHH